MAIKLEIILITVILLIVFATTTMKLTDRTSETNKMSKELEFYDTTFIEVDQTKMRANLFSTYGVREGGVLLLQNLIYHSHNIEKLTADKGTYKENILFLDGHVKLKEKEGFIYSAEHANYHQKKEVLTITSPFVAHMAKNIIYGKSLQYFAGTKEMNATGIDATVYTVEK